VRPRVGSDLDEGALVDQQVDALPRGQLASVAVAAETVLAPAQLGAPLEVGEPLVKELYAEIDKVRKQK